MKKQSAKDRSTKPSASGPTDQSMSAKDALELGCALVESLNLSEGNDTLGKWMAHHLAELIAKAERLPGGKPKSEVQKQVVDLIIKLWTHRGEFHNRINPLNALAPIMRVIQTLTADNYSWIPRHLSGEATGLYHVFRRLMIAAICSQAKTDPAPAASQAKKTTKFQSSEEKAIVAGLGIWSDALSPKPAPRVRIVFADDESERVEGDKNKSIEQITQDCIAEVRVALDKFEQELARRAEREAPKPTLKRKQNLKRTMLLNRDRANGALAKSFSSFRPDLSYASISVPIEIRRSDRRLSLASGVGFDASSFPTSAISLKPCFWLSARFASSAVPAQRRSLLSTADSAR
jgi:hypothetical protein